MNTAVNHSITSSKHASRAHFSASLPVAGSAHATAASVPLPVSITGYSYASLANAPEDFFSQIWTPGLLDRLQAPLTRYRE